MNNLPDSIQGGETLKAVQICPFGEYPNGRSLQLCDRTAFEQIVAAYLAGGKKEVLCDFEHKSEEESITSDTTAAAWIDSLAIDDARGLVGDFTFTDAGAEAVANRRLRFLSPVWNLDGAGRPLKLRSVALTNKPNIPTACVLNREPPEPLTVEDKKGKNDMEKLKEMLGLAPEASEDEILAAVGRFQEQITALNKDKEESEAESFADKHQAVCNKDALKNAYLLNKEAAKAMVEGFIHPPAPETPQVLLNKGVGNPPPNLKLNKAQAGLDACKNAQERCDYVMRHSAELAAGI